MGKVFYTALPPNLKLVLVTYADHANDDGSSVYPGEERLVAKTSYSTPTIRRITAELLATGILVQTQRGHRGTTAKYRIDVEALEAAHVEFVKEGYQDDTLSKGYQDSSERVSETSERVSNNGLKGIASDTPNHHEPSQPSETHHIAQARQNLAWDFYTSTDGFNLPTGTDAQKKRVGKLARELNAKIEHEHLTGDIPAELRRRALDWPLHFDTATLTPEAYEKWFTQIGQPPLRAGSKSEVEKASNRQRRQQALESL